MRFFSKNTQTLTGSLIANIGNIITRKKPKKQYVIISILSLFFLHNLLFIPLAEAIVDPTSVPNNKFGIHIITPSSDEASPAAELVNTNGDWGYITVLVESKNRNHDSWQEFFNDLRRRHLIPLIRLATEPEGNLPAGRQGYWKRPYEGEEQAWADFLDKLIWPTKNRYVIVYNEPNHATEWGNNVDPVSYAKVLDATITALKNENPDFFVLNAGFDASAPQKAPNYFDELAFIQHMEQAVPGIFNKLDGWATHSYPNPGFAGSPDADGRGTVRTWQWELQVLKQLGVTKNLPVFITETGWKHAEGLTPNYYLPDEDTVADYYKKAFDEAWNSSKIVTVTPFLLNYQETPFDHFSFKKPTGEKQKEKLIHTDDNVLGTQYPQYYAFYETIKNLPKTKGEPVQENLAKLIKGEVYSSVAGQESYDISLTFKNTGQSIWNEKDIVKAVAIQGGTELKIADVEIPKETKVEPGQEYTFHFKLTAPLKGTYIVTINLFSGSKQFSSEPVTFTTEVKSPVLLEIKTSLKWKNNPEGNYKLKVDGIIGKREQSVLIDKSGLSEDLIAKYLPPDYQFQFTLEKPFYHPKSITQIVHPGENILDFGVLQPDLFSNLLRPKTLWKLFPFSN